MTTLLNTKQGFNHSIWKGDIGEPLKLITLGNIGIPIIL